MRPLFFFSFLLLAPLLGSNSSVHHLTVNGEGEVSLTATTADVRIGIEVQRKTASDVQEELGVKLQPILEKLQTLQADKLETGSMQIFPEYDRTNAQKLIGYKGIVNLQFSTEASKAGGLIDAAIAAGANALNSVTLRPPESTLREARLKALELACTNALAKADVIIKTLGLENKGILQVIAEPLTATPYTRNYSFGAVAKSAPTLEITEQEQLITAQVQLQIELP